MPLKPDKDRVIWCVDQQRWELVTQEKFDELAKDKTYAIAPVQKMVPSPAAYVDPIHNKPLWDLLTYTLPHCSC